MNVPHNQASFYCQSFLSLFLFDYTMLFLGKLLVFGQTACFWANCLFLGKLLILGQTAYFWANCLFLGKLLIFGQRYHCCTAALSLFIIAALQLLVCLSLLHCSQTTHEWHGHSDCITLLTALQFPIHLYINYT